MFLKQLTCITKVALCFLLYIVGLNPTVIRVPAVPIGNNSPDCGNTENSKSLPTKKYALNGSGYLGITIKTFEFN